MTAAAAVGSGDELVVDGGGDSSVRAQEGGDDPRVPGDSGEGWDGSDSSPRDSGQI